MVAWLLVLVPGVFVVYEATRVRVWRSCSQPCHVRVAYPPWDHVVEEVGDVRTW